MKILSWNIQWGRGADGQVDLDRTIGEIRAGGEPDVICLQEVAQNVPGLKGGDPGDSVARLAAAFPGHTAVFGAAVDRLREDGVRARFGNMILSRLPVKQVFRHLLPSPADAGVPGMQRGCVEVVVESGDRPLRVLSTHLEYYSLRQRLAQAEALRGLQATVADNVANPPGGKDANPVFAPWPRPVEAVLCGDFNCLPDSDEYRALCAPLPHDAGWFDAWRLAHAGPHAHSVGLHGAEWPDAPYCCDFFWLAGSLRERVRRIEVLADTPASDHQPLVLELADH